MCSDRKRQEGLNLLACLGLCSWRCGGSTPGLNGGDAPMPQAVQQLYVLHQHVRVLHSIIPAKCVTLLKGETNTPVRDVGMDSGNVFLS